MNSLRDKNEKPILSTLGGAPPTSAPFTSNTRNTNSVKPPLIHPPLTDIDDQFEPAQECNTCRCRNSKCLKLYCECFATRQYCVDCRCRGCANQPSNLEGVQNAVRKILSRKPDAFKPKLSRRGSTGKSGKSHQKGCACQKSRCIKCYCDCYQSGIACGKQCRCKNCGNTAQHRLTMELNVENNNNTQTTTNNQQQPSPVSRPPVLASIEQQLLSGALGEDVIVKFSGALLSQVAKIGQQEQNQQEVVEEYLLSEIELLLSNTVQVISNALEQHSSTTTSTKK